MKRRNFLIGALVGLPAAFIGKKSFAHNASELRLDRIVNEINKYGYIVNAEHLDQKLKEVSLCSMHKRELVEDKIRVWKITDIQNKNPIFYVQKYMYGWRDSGSLYYLDSQCYLTDNWKNELYDLINKQPERLC